MPGVDIITVEIADESHKHVRVEKDYKTPKEDVKRVRNGKESRRERGKIVSKQERTMRRATSQPTRQRPRDTNQKRKSQSVPRRSSTLTKGPVNVYSNETLKSSQKHKYLTNLEPLDRNHQLFGTHISSLPLLTSDGVPCPTHHPYFATQSLASLGSACNSTADLSIPGSNLTWNTQSSWWPQEQVPNFRPGSLFGRFSSCFLFSWVLLIILILGVLFGAVFKIALG